MKAVKDWVSSQLVSSSLIQSRPLSGNGTFFGEGSSSSEIQGSTTASLPASADISPQPSIDSEGTQLSRNPDFPPSPPNQKRNDPLVKIEALQMKFMRLVHQLRQSPDNLLVAQVLYRLHLATLIRVGERDSVSRADTRAVAAQLEAAGSTESDFSVRILLLGKTGVGKSATINSIFNQLKVPTDAFQPATCHIQEVVGTTEGIKITFIDTPGLLPSSSKNVRDNRKILRSVKSFIRRRQQPDIVLYFERLDLINMGYSDLPLLKLITDTFGPAMWFNTILVTTHAAGPLPEGPNGYLVNYDSFVSQCTRLLQHYIHQAAAYSKIENPVLLVENHPECKRNISGEKVLPNGQAWRSQFLLLCVCTKVLGDANGLLKFRDGFQMGPSATTRLPSLPHLLSTLLQQRSTERQAGEVDDDVEDEEEDDYDQLPPIRILSKAQFEKLSKSQRNDYLDELDYRETLYLKKQLKAEHQNRRKSAMDDDEDGDQDTNPEAVQLPDIAVPQSFDSDSAGYRYRCLLTSDKWVARPVLDPQGWDHDVGFDGVNLETSLDLNTNLHASILGQVSKDKQDFSIQTESNVILTDLKGTSSISAGLDVQTAGKDLVCTSRGNVQLHNFKHNTTGCGVSLTSFGNKLFLGAKVEDRISIGKRVDFVVNAGRIGGVGQVAYGGNFETILKGRDYPVRNDKTSLSMTVLSFDKEIVLGGNIVSEFRVGRGSKISVNTNLNSRRMGQICIKTSSSDHLEIGAIALISILRAVFRRHVVKDTVEEED